ncbi:uncharacterized protein [Onthophagus taurus]|uniref:uncharacterized protein n=1 Tax=Onthophagus taurus TaxID=166361 RepID=UPI0039BE1160
MSNIARIYDPLGFLTQITFLVKKWMQQLWTLKLDWDDPLPNTIYSSWTQFLAEFEMLGRIQIPRFYGQIGAPIVDMHGFCDASESGYGAVIYLRISNSDKITTHLIYAKSRVAPLKQLSIPRLELCGAMLLADSIDYVLDALKEQIFINTLVTWTDSQIVLSWLSSIPTRWKTFVANRVAHIQEVLPKTHWRHISSESNPADCTSRGLTPAQLIADCLYWNGPHWLTMPEESWPDSSFQANSNETPPEEVRASLQVTTDLSIITYLLTRFSSLPKIICIVAYLLRFSSKLRHYEIIPSPDECHASLLKLIKMVQEESFPQVIGCLKANRLIPKSYRKLSLFLDDQHLIRVGGRLRRSQLDFQTCHPLLLPSKHRLTELIIENAHKISLHSGLKTLQYLLLQQFWILSSRRSIRRCLSKCLKCFRCRPRTITQPMSDLPSVRVTRSKPFDAICIDYAGPFIISMTRAREVKTTKAYVCVFVCCATKAIHLEVASDLSSDIFLAAFRRFVSRRGHCSVIYSDQGTNFVGARRQLEELSRQAGEQLSIKWILNPPSAPHFNGLAEAGVKSIKTHLNRVIGNQILSYEELSTLLTQIEAVLNSRPLCPISDDPNDLLPLTPGHFLISEPLINNVPSPDLAQVPVGRLTRWQLIQKMRDHFWSRWHQEYLHTLQQREKWTDPAVQINPGTMVLLKSDQHSSLSWKMGKILEVHPGQDGVTRVVTIKTATGTLMRPITKVCPLPIN